MAAWPRSGLVGHPQGDATGGPWPRGAPRLIVASHRQAHAVPRFKFLKLGCLYYCLFAAACLGGGQGLFLPVVVSKAALLYFFVSFSFRGTVNRSERARQDDLAIAHIGASVCTATYGRGRAHLLETTTELMPPAVARRRCGETLEESLRRRHLSRGRAPARPAALQI